MKQILHPAKHKIVIVAVATLGSLFVLHAASLALEVYQVGIFFKIAFWGFIFLFFWQAFIFDLHLGRNRSWAGFERYLIRTLKSRFAYLADGRHFLHFLNYLILPGIIYWMSVVLLYLNPFERGLKLGIILLSTLGLALSYWYMKTVFYLHHDAPRVARQLIFTTKLYGSYLAYAASLGIARYFGPFPPDENLGYDPLGAGWFAILVFCVTFALLYQALFQHHYPGYKRLEFLLVCAFLFALVGYLIYHFWNANYFGGALVLSALYNTTWAIIHHKYIDENLTREMVYEYLAVLFVVLVIVFSTTNFSARVY